MTVSQAIAELSQNFENIKLVDHKRLTYDVLVIITQDSRYHAGTESVSARMSMWYRNNLISQSVLWTLPDINRNTPDAQAVRRERENLR